MAVGNACFHIGGGIDSLKNAGGRLARSGIFVSSGALGVSIGTVIGKLGTVPVFLPIILLVLCLILISVFCTYNSKDQCKKTEFKVANRKFLFGTVILLSFLSIVIRSYAGSIVPMEWKTTTFLFVLPSIGAFIGKVSGGFLADRFGSRNIGVFSLLISALFLSVGYWIPFICVIGLLLFNMNMSITLCAIASKLPLNPGLSFGITTLALLCGNIPLFIFPLPRAPAIFAVLTILSALFIYVTVVNYGGRYNEKNI